MTREQWNEWLRLTKIVTQAVSNQNKGMDYFWVESNGTVLAYHHVPFKNPDHLGPLVFEELFPTQDPEYLTYLRLKKKFEGNDSAISRAKTARVRSA